MRFAPAGKDFNQTRPERIARQDDDTDFASCLLYSQGAGRVAHQLSGSTDQQRYFLRRAIASADIEAL